MAAKVEKTIYKPLVLSDSWLNSLGAKFIYGLPTYHVEFSGDNENTFNMFNKEENISVKANFSYSESWITNYNKTTWFEDSFIKMNQNPWFTDELNFNAKDPHCAFNKYNWNKNFKLRFMNTSFEINWGNIFNGKFEAGSLQEKQLGAVEIEGDFVISPRQGCESKNISSSEL